MHSKDAAKLSGPLYTAFIEEFEATLERAGDTEAHFDWFVFPEIKLDQRVLKPHCIFCKSQFCGKVTFYKASFKRVAFFISAYFQQEADFRFATFEDNAEFLNTCFAQNVNFGYSTFTKTARYPEARFKGLATWENAQFLGNATFRSAYFDAKSPDKPSGSFASTSFSAPENITFDSVDLSRVTFIDCDVTEIKFSSSVEWGNEGKRRGIIFEELLIRGESSAEIGSRSVDHRSVSQIYQQLKKNHDSRLAYWTADEFHFGEMEMKRLSDPEYGPLRELRSRLKRNLGLVALYRWASDYGNSYVKPIVWLSIILVIFAALFPGVGIDDKQASSRGTQTYSSVWSSKVSLLLNLDSEMSLVGRSLLTSIDTATFQRNSEYTPSYPWGRSLAIAETLLTSTLFALFLLAIRRQFRR